MNHQISILIILILILTGCSNEIGIEEEPHPINEVPVPILIMPKGIDATTKALVDEFTKENINEIGIYGTSNTKVIYNGISPSQIGNNQELIFTNTSLVYPADGNSITLAGYYPRQSKGTAYTINNNSLQFTLTGEEDLMYAASINAGNKKAPEAVNLNFTHKLTNVKFNLVNGTDNILPDGYISITTDTPNSGSLDLSNGTITIDKTSITTFALSTNINANTLASKDTISVNENLLLFPELAYTFKLRIGDQSYNIQIDTANQPAWKEGISYLLTITIKKLNTLKSFTKSDDKAESLSDSFIQCNISQIKK
ncbi:fimbrillin family protein [Parabacteroides faecis]|uniref:fimbrillin family protein n=1 Tax=Parabacteroides faecis TaxID=1217282 RepID=UPI0021643390|nr:fimbrillin family protein [Parabacteroides faecis]MCS2890210.1 fimbrillin family protein [Parabacteroides faecis]UVQ46096.1 fimbrillin family protein [Parabacteroides faecis]